jgi:hypothetical protein
MFYVYNVVARFAQATGTEVELSGPPTVYGLAERAGVIRSLHCCAFIFFFFSLKILM